MATNFIKNYPEGYYCKYSQTCVQQSTLGPEKSGCLKDGPHKSEI
jgi:hypothetical protein